MSAIKQLGLLGLLFLLLSSSCQKEKRVRIFELAYQNLEFDIPAGFNGSQALIFEFPELKTNFESFLNQSGADPATVGGIFPLNARITSFDGTEYYYIQEVEIRVCPSIQADCTAQIDGVFYIEELNGRADDDIDLQPGLQNVKDLMSGEYFRVEVVLFLDFGQITPFDQPSRLDMTFEVTE
ncbi:MAG: hypothetical protein DWQ02_01295 [Bacteroidetes bacterium]|nr:MAG: hypothetical protein DWQ02_01295 [Bacteroidota bacterium]